MNRRARKRHQCACCLEWIDPGTLYYFERLTPWTSGDAQCWGNFRAHIACIVEYHENDWWDGDGLWEDGEFRNSLVRREATHMRVLMPGILLSKHPRDECPRRQWPFGRQDRARAMAARPA